MTLASETVRIRLRALIESRGKSMGEVSERAGLSRTAIRDIMNGRAKSPGIDTLQAIAKALNVSLPELFVEPTSQEHVRILRLLGQLSPEAQLKMIGFAEGIAASQAEPLPESQD